MYFAFGLRSSLLLIFFVHLIVYAFIFFKRSYQQDRLSDRLLSIFFLLAALFIAPWMTGFGGWYDQQPYRDFLFYAPLVQPLFFGPLLYLYIKALTNATYEVKGKDWLHFLPGALYLLWSLTVVVVDKLVLKRYYLMNGKTDPDFDIWYSWLWVLSVLIYLLLTLRYYRQYLAFANLEYSFAETAGFRWLRNFLYVFALLTLLFLIEHILGLFIELEYVRAWYYFLAFAVISYYMAISAYSSNPVPELKLNFEPELLQSYQDPKPVTVGDEPDPEWYNPWKAKLELAMTEKLYLNPELTLSEVAKKLGTNASLLSKVVNGGYGQNFNDYINSHRVSEAIRLMNDPQYRNYSLLAIAYEAGFNSKSTFNRAFKKATGAIPRDHLEK